jgi:hypothetical protein
VLAAAGCRHNPLLPRRAGPLRRPAQLPRAPLKPAQGAAGIEPLGGIYDLRHTFATFALRAGISTFDLSRYVGASLTMIDRHYGHLARDGREHAIRLLYELSGGNVHGGRWWTLRGRHSPRPPPMWTTAVAAKQEKTRSPLTDSNRRSPPYQVATHGNGFGLISRLSGVSDFATGCDRSQPLGSITAPSLVVICGNTRRRTANRAARFASAGSESGTFHARAAFARAFWP